MAILSCWRRWAPGAAGRFCRRCCCSLQRLWTRQSLQQPLAFGPWLALAGGGIFLWQQMV